MRWYSGGIVNIHFHVTLNPERTTTMCSGNTCHKCHVWLIVFYGDFYSKYHLSQRDFRDRKLIETVISYLTQW